MTALVRPSSSGHSSRILAVRGGALGDFILTLPALQGLRQACGELHLLTRPAYGKLAFDFGIVSGWRALEAPEMALLHARRSGLDPSLRTWLGGFDCVVSWVPDPDGIFQEQVRRCGVPEFCQGDWRCAGSGPAAEQLAQGIPWLKLPFGNHEFLPGIPSHGPGTIRPWIALHPGSGSPRKNWPIDHWLKVMRHFQQTEPAIRWRIVTGEVEQDRLDSLYGVLDDAGLPWEPVHDLPLTALAHRLQECQVFLGHDSGVAHLAAACGVNCRILFGPTNPAVWAPPGDHVRILRADEGDWSLLPPETVRGWLEDTWPPSPGSGSGG